MRRWRKGHRNGAAQRDVCDFKRSPAKAGVQEREALQFLRPKFDTLLRIALGPGLRRGTTVKPLNVWPMVILLIAVVLLIVWLRPHS
jgi:hypothetical protein